VTQYTSSIGFHGEIEAVPFLVFANFQDEGGNVVRTLALLGNMEVTSSFGSFAEAFEPDGDPAAVGDQTAPDATVIDSLLLELGRIGRSKSVANNDYSGKIA
jgi:hypothetical protein